MTRKLKGDASMMKSVATHILYVHCIIHAEYLVATNIRGKMLEALNTAIYAINTVNVRLNE